MGIIKYYVTAIRQGGDDRNAKTLRAESLRAVALLKSAHERWAIEIFDRRKNNVPLRPCPSKACLSQMPEVSPGYWECLKCGSSIVSQRV